jgi:hypothetical protein
MRSTVKGFFICKGLSVRIVGVRFAELIKPHLKLDLNFKEIHGLDESKFITHLPNNLTSIIS